MLAARAALRLLPGKARRGPDLSGTRGGDMTAAGDFSDTNPLAGDGVPSGVDSLGHTLPTLLNGATPPPSQAGPGTLNLPGQPSGEPPGTRTPVWAWPSC